MATKVITLTISNRNEKVSLHTCRNIDSINQPVCRQSHGLLQRVFCKKYAGRNRNLR